MPLPPRTRTLTHAHAHPDKGPKYAPMHVSIHMCIRIHSPGYPSSGRALEPPVCARAPSRTRTRAHSKGGRYTHACIHTCNHAYISTYVHGYIQSYICIVTHIVEARSRRTRAHTPTHTRAHAHRDASYERLHPCARARTRTFNYIHVHCDT